MRFYHLSNLHGEQVAIATDDRGIIIEGSANVLPYIGHSLSSYMKKRFVFDKICVIDERTYEELR